MNLVRIALAALFAVATSAQAAQIDWNTWTSTTTGSISTAGGPIGVTFSGPAVAVISSYPSYTPVGTFADGVVVNNAPVAANGIMQLTGGSDAINTVTFATAVVNPVMAIWSLGQGGINANFSFTNATPTFVSGGPNAEYGGLPINVVGNVVSGVEGNGTVQFIGTFNSISWTNPVYENWYGFNVGVAAIPEPQTYALMLLGLALVGVAVRRRKGP